MKYQESEINDNLYIVIGREVKRLRIEKAKVSVLRYSKAIGLHRDVYTKIENGTGEYYISTLKRALSYYPDMTLSKFFTSLGL